MAEKRYYWLKLKDDFFEDDTIKYIEEQENGVEYINFYLKLCLKAIKSEGKLIRFVGETLIPYDVRSLSKLTGVDSDTVAVAMNLFQQIGLVKILETGELFLSQIDEMIGSETKQAEIMRKKRALEKANNIAIESGNNVTSMLPECYTEIEIEKELRDKEIEKKSKEETIEEEFAELWEMYPNKKGKANALKAYKKARTRKDNPVSFETVMNGIVAYNFFIKETKTDMKYVKYGSTFFNQESWNDDFTVYETPHKESGMEQMQRIYQESMQTGGEPF